MIQYALRCDQGHEFDSWFQSASAFDALKAAGHLTCVVCGATSVDKAIMAPRVSVPATKDAADLRKAETPEEKALAELKTHVETNADYVGSKFAQEARSMYLGSAPERPIYGEANGAEAKKLIEDGVPVVPLPFTPTKKAN
ncbi:DUF1178 family protein [Roseobacter sp.]|uniref:DUF1178 family protein n=1 Tax=Roseobacter sp. TaxID=1907202 RepID=UPI003298ACD6